MLGAQQAGALPPPERSLPLAGTARLPLHDRRQPIGSDRSFVLAVFRIWLSCTLAGRSAESRSAQALAVFWCELLNL